MALKMCRVLYFLTFFAFAIIFHSGNAKFECPVPPKSSLVYLDLEALNSLALQQSYHNAFHSPLLCVKGKDEECKDQQCCPDEEGCCLSSSREEDERHIRKCGCKKPLDDKCTFPAPFALLANSNCKVGNNLKISACLRERRADEYLAEQAGLRTRSKPYSKKDDDNLLVIPSTNPSDLGIYRVVTQLVNGIRSGF